MTTYPSNFRVENVTPILNVSDISRSLSFYVKILGFKNADWGDDNFTAITKDSGGLYLCKNAQGSPKTWIWVGFDGDIFQLHEHFKSNGTTIILPPTNFYHSFEMRVEDPDGHIIRLGTEPDENKPFVEI